MSPAEKLSAELVEANRPDLIETESHVYEVWNDGEITLTKAAGLFRQRTLHAVAEPVIPRCAALSKPDLVAKVDALWDAFLAVPKESPENLAALERYKEAQKALKDPWSSVVESRAKAFQLRRKFIDYWYRRCNITNGQ